ncbi:DUF29 domain-containing protein [Crocosphaera sp.]|uniref:DUF29 domain-containing protein n=1 Tax=Crocosphaera sp. TaxID=2729996 RepID=UPI003F27EAA1|nr:DUF29 domain-containing protein [Crocosphaera sp.]
MANLQGKTENNKTPNKSQRFVNFAQFFKDYMSVSTIIVAALPIAFDRLGVIPGFDVHKQFLPTYTSLFCFLILAFSFFSRYRLAWWMFHNELNGRSIGLARQFKTILRFLPFFLIGICFTCIIWYHNVLDQSVQTIKCELQNPPCNVDKNPPQQISEDYKEYDISHEEYMKKHKEYMESAERYLDNNQNGKISNEQYVEEHKKYVENHEKYINIVPKNINLDNSLKYFGRFFNLPKPSDIGDPEAKLGQLNSEFILKNADPSAINIINNSSSSSEYKWLQSFGNIVLITLGFLIVCTFIFFIILKLSQFKFLPIYSFILALFISFILALIVLGIIFIFEKKGINSWIDQSIIPFISPIFTKNSQLIISYLGIFIAAETAFILMALREYLQDALDDPDDSDLFRKVNAGKLEASVCQNINNQDSREICYFFLEANAKLERDDAQKKIIALLNDGNLKEYFKPQSDILNWIFDPTNFRQKKIYDTLYLKFDEFKDCLEEKNRSENLKQRLEKLKEAFTTLNKWEKVEEIDSIMSKLQPNYKFNRWDLLSNNSHTGKDYYSSLESAIKTVEAREKNGLTFEKLLADIQKLKEEKEKETEENLSEIIFHLLKWNYQPDKRCQGWINSINEHRQNLYNDFETSPSLENYCEKSFDTVYKEARQKIFVHTIPDKPPFSWEDTLNKDYLEISGKGKVS